MKFLRRWWSRYWPWGVAAVWLIGYELYAAITKRRKTLSQLVWAAHGRAWWLPWLVGPIVVLVWLHFFHGLWGPSQPSLPDVQVVTEPPPELPAVEFIDDQEGY
jgi:hypothetical protein